MLVLTILCGAVVGVSLGLTGGGGSILAVPLLVYLLAVPAESAVSISLGAVGITSLVGAVQRGLRSEIEMKTGLLFAGAGILGAPAGTWIGGHVPEAVLLVLFAGLMVTVAVRMWLKASGAPSDVAEARAFAESPSFERRGPACRRDPEGRLPLTSRCLALLLVAGLTTGILSGLFGVGGGFVIVPALVLLTSLDIHRAVATSLMVIALISAAGLGAHLYAGRDVPMDLALPFAAGGVAGMFAGAAGAKRLSPQLLQKIFAVVIVAVALYVIVRNFFG
jgi:uncharacterized membrane protein YfcA